ncbi:MAG: formate dehydrogenase accessory sulfurtransferase FdhD [Sarcina sp.]
MIKKFDILKCFIDENIETLDSVVEETPLTIIVNGKEYITIMCTPTYLEDLTAGFLFQEGLIKTKDDILELYVSSNKTNIANVTLQTEVDFDSLYHDRVITSGSKGSLYYKAMNFMEELSFKNNIKINKSEIMNTMKVFFTRSKLFADTGGVHSVLLKNNSLEIFREDIGRHNAIDKSIGYLLLNSIPIDDFAIYVSGRLSSEMISKISKAGISVAISRACPTSLSVNLARKMNMTIIGFSRGDRFNIYSARERIDINE